MPLGPTEAIEDPRLVRIGNFEDGVSGRHDAARVLGPFIASIAGRASRTRVAVLLHDDESMNKIAQTLLEMIRGGLSGVPVDVTVFYPGRRRSIHGSRRGCRSPFVHCRDGVRGFAEAARPGGFDYVLLFESSGMYRGEETVPLLRATGHRAARRGVGQPAAVGPRHRGVVPVPLSPQRRCRARSVTSGSYVLSLACLVLYGRYITDTLSGVRARPGGRRPAIRAST